MADLDPSLARDGAPFVQRGGWLHVLTSPLLAVFAAGVIRLAVLALAGQDLAVDRDLYLEIARHLAAGEGFARGEPPTVTAYRPPLYPLLLSLVFRCGGALFSVGLLQAALGALTVWLTCRLARRVLPDASPGVIAAAGWLVALDPLLVQYTVFTMTETLCATLAVAWLLSEVAALDAPSPRRDLTAGALLGLGCLCRPTFLVCAAAVWIARAIFVLLTAWLRLSSRGPMATSGPLQVAPLLLSGLRPAWCLAFVLTLAPWTLRNRLVLGVATPATTHGGYTLLLANNPVFYDEVVRRPWGTAWEDASLRAWQADLEAELDAAGIVGEPARDRWFYDQARRYIVEHPRAAAEGVLWRVARFWDVGPHGPAAARLPPLVRYGVWIWYGLQHLGLVCGLVVLARRRPSVCLAWGLVLLSTTALHAWFWTDLRMRAPFIPLIAVACAVALAEARRRTSAAAGGS